MKKIRKALFLLNIVLALFAAAGYLHRMQHTYSMNAQETEPLEKKKVALTFDDGPSPGYTEDLLDGLKERNVKATFFLIGQKAEANPELVRRIALEGHVIGNHSYSHINLGVLSDEKACDQISHTNQIICDITGTVPQYLRSPFGSTHKNLDCKMDMIEVLWDVDPRDWDIQNTAKIVNRVVSKVQDGDIILLHDGYDSSTAAAFQIIDTLEAEGYEFVTVDELLFD